MISERCRLVAEYRRLLAPVSGIALPSEPEWAKTNWQSLCACLSAPGIQSAVLAALNHAGIERRPAFRTLIDNLPTEAPPEPAASPF